MSIEPHLPDCPYSERDEDLGLGGQEGYGIALAALAWRLAMPTSMTSTRRRTS